MRRMICVGILCLSICLVSCHRENLSTTFAPTPAPDARVDELRNILDRLVAARATSTNEEAEKISDVLGERIIAMPRAGIVAILDQAAGNDQHRRKETIMVLSYLADLPEAAERVGQALRDPDPEVRATAAQTVGNYKLTQFAASLNPMMAADPDAFARTCAIASAGAMKEPVNLPVLLSLGDAPGVLRALAGYGHPDTRPFLEKIFQDSTRNRTDLVFAAWGLAKMGDRKAHAYLVTMLDDPPSTTHENSVTVHDPGVSLRAAEALCDVHGWDCDTPPIDVENLVPRVKERIQQLGTAATP